VKRISTRSKVMVGGDLKRGVFNETLSMIGTVFMDKATKQYSEKM
jgi:hypothetical protein